MVESRVDVKETVEIGSTRQSFVKTQGIDCEAAFQRMRITKELLGQYQVAINETNTADVIGKHKSLYDDLETLAKAIIDEEMILIAMCK